MYTVTVTALSFLKQGELHASYGPEFDILLLC